MRASVRVLVVLLLAVSPGAAQTAPTFLQQDSQVSTTTTYTFSAANLGTAAANRYIIVASAARKSGTTNCTRPTVTVQGLTPTQIVSQARNPTNCNIVAIDKVAVPTGTTGDIVLTYPAAMLLAGISVYRSTSDRVLAASNTGASAADDPTGTITIQPHGYAIGVSMTSSAGATTTWTGLTESHDTAISASNNHTSALLAPATLQSAITVTADWSAAVESAGVWAAWAPIGPVAVAPTHYATDSGNGSSNCLLADPCTLTRAFALAGGDLMPPGSYVSIAAGIYSQAEITTTGGGTAAFPIRMVGAGVGQTRITGTRTFLPGAGFSLVGGRTYTYSMAFDEAAIFTVDQVCQRPPVVGWTPIPVDDRAPPFTTPSFRSFTLDQPVCYTRKTTVDDVEAVHCTSFHDTAANLLYIHPCKESAPADADNLYASVFNWGKITYNSTGDYLTLEDASLEQTTGDGIHVDPGAVGVQLKRLTALHARFYLEGVQTVGEDLKSTQYFQQGSDTIANCYPDRQCWNDNGDGYQFVFGEENSGVDYDSTFTRITIERGWNGFVMSGSITLDRASCWGIVNHCGSILNTGGTLTNGIFTNSQDSLYSEGEDIEGMTIEHNLFRNGVLIQCSRDGALQGGTDCPTAWTFSHNILSTFVTDHLTAPSRTGDCNVWIPRNSGQTIYRETPVDGVGSDPQYDTLAEIIAGTNDEDNSREHPFTSWTDLSIFASFTSQETYPANFSLTASGTDALTTCGTRAGPDTLNLFSVPARWRMPLRLRSVTP